jgi:hypothetical protein
MFGLRYRKMLLSIKLNAQVIPAGSSGIARFATALVDKNAGCHTPPAVRVRGGSTVGYFASVAKPVKVRSVCRYSYGDTAIKGLSHRPSPLDTYIIPQTAEKVNSFYKIFSNEYSSGPHYYNATYWSHSYLAIKTTFS